MQRPLVVPLDGTPRAEEAIPLALQAARTLGTSLHLVRVHDPLPAPYSAFGDSREIIGPANDRIHQEETTYLAVTGARVQEWNADPPATALLVGPLRETLLEYVEEQKAALVVMAPHFRRGLRRILTASVSGYLIRKSPVPVLLAGSIPEEEGGEVRTGPFGRVLAPVAEIEEAEAIAVHLSSLAPESEVTFLLLQALMQGGIADRGPVPAAPSDAARALLGVVSLRREGHPVEVLVRGGASVDDIVAEESARIRPDLIAVAMHRNDRPGRLIPRWRARNPRDAATPILVVGPAARQAAPR